MQPRLNWGCMGGSRRGVATVMYGQLNMPNVDELRLINKGVC